MNIGTILANLVGMQGSAQPAASMQPAAPQSLDEITEEYRKTLIRNGAPPGEALDKAVKLYRDGMARDLGLPNEEPASVKDISQKPPLPAAPGEPIAAEPVAPTAPASGQYGGTVRFGTKDSGYQGNQKNAEDLEKYYQLHPDRRPEPPETPLPVGQEPPLPVAPEPPVPVAPEPPLPVIPGGAPPPEPPLPVAPEPPLPVAPEPPVPVAPEPPVPPGAPVAPGAPPGGGAPPPAAEPPPEEPAPPSAIAEPVAEAYKSPPDLVKMYMKLIEDSSNAARLDRGMTLIAAGLAQPQNRAGLISMAAGMGGGSGSPSISMNDIIELQKLQAAESERETQRGMLPQIMEQYGLSEAEVGYLDSTGQLDEALKELATPETEVVEAADKSKKLINSRTGETIRELSDAAPRATEYTEMADGSKILVYSDTKAPVAGGTPIMSIGTPLGDIQVETLADGRKQATQDGKPLGDPWGPETRVDTDDMLEWAAIAAQEKAAGKPVPSLKEWILERTRAGTEAGNLGPTGIDYGDPPQGTVWKRNKAGVILLDEDGAPEAVWIKNSPQYRDYLKSQQELEAAEAEAKEEEAGDIKGAQRDAMKRSIYVQNIDRAIEMMEESADDWIGVGGWAGHLGWIPASEQMEFNGLLSNITTNIGLAELQAIRDASPTGGALGSITEQEHVMLRQVFGDLRATNDPELIDFNLRRIRAGVDIIANGFEYEPGKYRAPTPSEIDAAMAAVERRTLKPGSTKLPPGFRIEKGVHPNDRIPTSDEDVPMLVPKEE